MGTTTSPTPASIRNIALVGHTNAGKTTLAEALLHRAGAIPRAGSIAEGNTVTDHEPEEIARGISVSMGVAQFEWKVAGETYHLTLMDTPGYADFAGSVDAALAVADLAVVVVSAASGVQAGTEEVWRLCEEADIPRVIVVTQEDKARADFRTVLQELRDAFGGGVVPLEMPIGEEEDLHGVAEILDGTALEYAKDGTHHSGELPSDMVDEEQDLHDQVIEEIVTHDDEQLERYLSGEEPDRDELERILAREVKNLEAFPVLVCSAVTGVGIDRLVDMFCCLGPSPAQRPAKVVLADTGDGKPVADRLTEIEANPAGDTLVHVFRTVVDPFVGQVSMFKVLSGTVKPNDRLTATDGGHEERMHGMFRILGREHLPMDTVGAGNIAGVAKLGVPTGTLLAAKPSPVTARPTPQRPPVYQLALKPQTQADDDKLSAALARLSTEDPTLHADLTGSQAVFGGLGDTHLAVALERLARTFGVHVDTESVDIPYRETIAKAVEAEGKVKKQSGGHGQFAVVQLRVAPLPRGSGLQFVDSTVGGSVPRNYMAAVEKGVQEAMAGGGPHGYEVVDMKVEVYDGKAHAVDSSDMAFRTAAAVGVREALAKAGTVVLEPVSAVTVKVPIDGQGDVMGDLSTRRGRITSTTSLNERWAQVDALVPEAELARYVLDLRSITGGRGSFYARPDRYEPMAVPPPAKA